MTFKAVGFDYGGVIAGIPGTEFEKKVINLLGVDLATFQNIYFEFNYLTNNNVMSLENFWKKVVEELRGHRQILGANEVHKRTSPP